MYSDDNYLLFTIVIIAFIILTITVSQTCAGTFYGKMNKFCCLFILITYPFLVYIIIKSIENTKKSKNNLNKQTRYIINGLLLFLLLIIWLIKLYQFIPKLKLKTSNNKLNNNIKTNNKLNNNIKTNNKLNNNIKTNNKLN